jgi:iron-sulfur cluster assembly accessory protein
MNKTMEGNIALTAAAETFIRRIMRFTTSAEAGFRLRVSPGGCSGLSVTFDLAPEPEPHEVIWTPSGLRIFLDAGSCLLLDEAVVDFTETRSQTGFFVTTKGVAGKCCSQASTMVSIASLVRG